MLYILAKIKGFVNENFSNIMLFVIIVLLVLFAFAAGYITAKYQFKEPITIEQK